MRRAACLTALACLWLPAPAAGQAVEERPSSDSPAGSEYAIPLERAREQAGGGPSGDSTAGVGQIPSGLFGTGVGLPLRADRPADGSDAPGGRAGGAGPGDPGGPRGERPTAVPVPPPLAGDGGLSGVVLALVLAVLLLGGGVGLLARRAGAP